MNFNWPPWDNYTYRPLQPPSEARPLVRLRRVNHVDDVRIAECLRILARRPGKWRNVIDGDFARELVRRGVFNRDSAQAFYMGEWKLSYEGAIAIRRVVRLAAELRLCDVVQRGNSRFLARITEDGLRTLADWDDVTADGAPCDR